MQETLFYIFSITAVLCGLLAVANPFTQNTITRALYLVLSILSVASLFVLLNAFFIAVIQVLIYAGTVVVFFLFVLMFVDLKQEEKQKIKLYGLICGVIASAILLFILAGVVKSVPRQSTPATLVGDPVILGRALFTDGEFLLPFEVISVLLLSAITGAVFLASRERGQ